MLKIDDKGEAFDWAWGLLHWLYHNHGSMYCDKYAASSKIVLEYNVTNVPSIDFADNSDDENWEYDEEYNAKIVYHSLTEDNWQEYMTEFCRYMENEWDDD